jgi:hypothetical protein
MHRPLLLVAVLAGCLNLTAVVEAKDRDGRHWGHGRSFAHEPFAHQPSAGRHGFANRQAPRFADRHEPHWFGSRQQRPRFADRHHDFGNFGFAPRHREFGFKPRQHDFGFGHRRGLRFGDHLHSPGFARVVPRPGFGFDHHRFGTPHRQRGATVILRDPGFRPRW